MMKNGIHSSSEVSRSALDALVASLDSACNATGEPAGDLVMAAVQRACVQPELLTDAQRQGDPDRYTRHLLHADPADRYTLVALVWEPGQHSPVHAHHTWCSYGVVEGPLREECYVYQDDAAKAQLVESDDRSTGAACFTQAGLEGIHRLGNAGSQRAVSIHVYGVEAARVRSGVNRLVSVAAA